MKKTIEEMARTISPCSKKSCDGCIKQGRPCHDFVLSKKLYDAGYRKTFTSEFASETQKAFKEGYAKGFEDKADYERKLENGDLVSGDYHAEQMCILQCEIEQYKAEIERLTEVIERYECVNKLLEMDIEDLHKEREKRVEEVYADFMKDYKIMRDELNELYDENSKLQQQNEELQCKVDDYEKPKKQGL